MKNCKNKALSFVLCMVLIVAMALCMTACSTTDDPLEVAVTSFTVEVTDADGSTETFNVTTNKATVGEALLEQGLIAGEKGPYGLYVTEVNGIVADYDENQTFWAFYINGESALNGVDGTTVEEGAVYGFKVEK